MSKLNEEQKLRVKKLVEALRSGEFKQGKGALKVDDRFCCLGVATELYRREVGGTWEYYGGACGSDKLTGTDEPYILPDPVASWYGLPNVPVVLGSDDLGQSVTNMNDSGASFAVIADAFERQFLAPETVPDQEVEA